MYSKSFRGEVNSLTEPARLGSTAMQDEHHQQEEPEIDEPVNAAAQAGK
jgi:hypothetical protein